MSGIEHRRPILPEPATPDPGRLARLDAIAGLLIRAEIVAARQQTEAPPAGRGRGKRRRAAPQLPPALRRIEIQQAPAPDRPNATILRARVRDPLRRLVRTGSLAERHLAAANRLRDMAELALARLSPAVREPGGVSLGTSGSPPTPVAVIGACEEFAAAWSRVPPAARPVMLWVLATPGTLAEGARHLRMRKQGIYQLLRNALDALADHFGL